MSQFEIDKIRSWTNEEISSPYLLISQEDCTLHLGYYAGMGTADSTPIEQLPPIYKEIIGAWLESGLLRQAGESFPLYPGSHLFKRLILDCSY